MMRILIVSDAWQPQVNGVVRTLTALVAELEAMGHVAEVLGPDRFRTVRMPGDAGIRLALPGGTGRLIEAFAPDALHVATEGPLGWAARRWALRRGMGFSTSFTTRFPDYARARLGVPASLGYWLLRRFHNRGGATLVATPSLRAELAGRGFRKLRPWTRGVDLGRFHPGAAAGMEDWPRPIFLSVGRVAAEKNLAAFLRLDLPGTKIVVGDGPQRAALQAAYPSVHFLGERHGAALAQAYAAADVFVFPSLTDTFGLVLLESLASGTPVAAFPVTGPRDVLADAPDGVGALDTDLRQAAMRALRGDRAACRAHAARFSWRACAEGFLAGLVPRAG